MNLRNILLALGGNQVITAIATLAKNSYETYNSEIIATATAKADVNGSSSNKRSSNIVIVKTNVKTTTNGKSSLTQATHCIITKNRVRNKSFAWAMQRGWGTDPEWNVKFIPQFKTGEEVPKWEFMTSAQKLVKGLDKMNFHETLITLQDKLTSGDTEARNKVISIVTEQLTENLPWLKRPQDTAADYYDEVVADLLNIKSSPAPFSGRRI